MVTIRLTLRTLLGWLDGVLPPEEQRFLGERVAGSRFATRLAGHIKTAVARNTIDAPPSEGGWIGDDPNIVAEYLDNTLASQFLEAFERLCIESEMYLAEVGSCHGMLAELQRSPRREVVLDAASQQRFRERLRWLLTWMRACRPGHATESANDPGSNRMQELRDSQKAARALVTAMVIEANTPVVAPAPVNVWQRVTIDVLIDNGLLSDPGSRGMPSLITGAAWMSPIHILDRFGGHSFWLAGVSAFVLLTTILVVCGMLSSPGPSAAFQPVPGCFQCTEP